MAENENSPLSVSDAKQDIAMNYNLSKMIVDLPGRVPNQKIHCLLDNGGLPRGENSSYTTENAPQKDADYWILPTSQEKAGTQDTKEFLVVGLFNADDPNKEAQTTPLEQGQGATSTTSVHKGKYKGKGKINPMSEMEGIQRPSRVLRAVFPISEKIESSGDVFIAVPKENGLCGLRRGRSDMVFYFKEFLGGISLTNRRDREAKIGDNYKEAATTTKIRKDTGYKVQVHDRIEGQEAIATTPETHTTSLMRMMCIMGRDSQRNDEQIHTIHAIRDMLAPIIARAKNRRNDVGISEFLFNRGPITPETCSDMLEALKESYPTFPDIEPVLVQRLHQALVEKGLMASLEAHQLPEILQLVHKLSSVDDLTTDDGLDRAINYCMVFLPHTDQRFRKSIPFEPVKHPGPSTVSGDMSQTHKVWRNGLHALRDSIKNSNAELEAQLGGLRQYKSLEDLMRQASNVADTAAFRLHIGEIAAFMAQLSKQSTHFQLKFLDMFIRWIDEALGSSIED